MASMQTSSQQSPARTGDNASSGRGNRLVPRVGQCSGVGLIRRPQGQSEEVDEEAAYEAPLLETILVEHNDHTRQDGYFEVVELA